MNKITWRK